MLAEKRAIAKQLQAKINEMQGLGKKRHAPSQTGLELFATAFPDLVFPINTIHEFISYEPMNAAATSGFISAVAGKIMKGNGICVWVGNQKIFPSGLQHFGLNPDTVIFIHCKKIKDILWIIEEALKCEALTAVIGEIKELGFTESRRLQLAVEQSGVTCFIHRYCPYSENNTACTTRWKIVSLSSFTEGQLPGIGQSCWNVELLKVRNGKPHSWHVSWSGNTFFTMTGKIFSIVSSQNRNAG